MKIKTHHDNFFQKVLTHIIKKVSLTFLLAFNQIYLDLKKIIDIIKWTNHEDDDHNNITSSKNNFLFLSIFYKDGWKEKKKKLRKHI